jgi:hypothetical protein
MCRQLALTDIIKMPMVFAFTDQQPFRMKVQPRFVAMVSIPMRHAGQTFVPIMAGLSSY